MKGGTQIGHAFPLSLIAGIMTFAHITANAENASKKSPAAGKAKADGDADITLK